MGRKNQVNVKNWRKEITGLMRDFGFPDDDIDHTIRYVLETCNAKFDQNICYRAAWRHMISMMD